MIGYRLARPLLKLVTAVFFRKVEVVGLEHVSAGRDRPVVFVGNHPNSLIDPVLVMVSTSRIVRFAAKDTLFRVPLLGTILRAMGAVPLARRADHPEGSLDNRAAFETLSDVLASGGAIGIFPEGVSHEASQLQRLKTGAARIALGVATRRPELRLRIVPCGLTYVHRKRFRSRVLVQFGAPMEIGRECASVAEVDEPREVRRLTGEIEAALRDLTVNAADWETVRFLDGVRRLYQPRTVSLPERIELARRFNLVYPSVKDVREVAELRGRVGRYLERLNEARLSDRDLRRRIPPHEVLGKIARQLLLVLVWLPLAIPGLVVHCPVGLLAAYSARWLTPREDVLATTKLISGLVGCILLYAVLLLAVLSILGWPWAVVVAVALPVTGHAALVVVDRGASLRGHAVTLGRLLFLRQELESLRGERALLEAVVARAVDRLRPPHMAPLFSREAKAPEPD